MPSDGVICSTRRIIPASCVIFDIDGTLVDSNAFDNELYRKSITDVFGPIRIRPDWSHYEHVTDSGILREICWDNDLDFEADQSKVRERFGQLVGEYLARSGACCARYSGNDSTI